MRKPEHVPETRTTEAKPNRRERRHPDRAEQTEAPSSRRDGETQPDVGAAPQEVGDPRAKSSGHDKKTADKWNQ
jgi:hypothetical protein